MMGRMTPAQRKKMDAMDAGSAGGQNPPFGKGKTKTKAKPPKGKAKGKVKRKGN